MSALVLTAEEVVDPHETPAHQLRLVSTGIAPTAEVQAKAAKGPDTPACYRPCGQCGAVVLTGITPAGESVALETGVATYTVDFPKGATQPVLYRSRGYPAHICPSHHKEVSQ
jgi:hypothetical protein